MSDGQTVPIAEHNELNTKMFRDLLSARGYATLAARDSAEALDPVRRHRPDLDLVDNQLATVSGLEIITSIKADAEPRSIPVVALSVFATDGMRKRCASSGARPV